MTGLGKDAQSPSCVDRVRGDVCDDAPEVAQGRPHNTGRGKDRRGRETRLPRPRRPLRER